MKRSPSSFDKVYLMCHNDAVDQIDFRLSIFNQIYQSTYIKLAALIKSYCHFCVYMSANYITVKELRTAFDKKLAPLKVEIAKLTSFIENANQKYDQVLKKLTEQEKECKEEIKKENKFLKSTVNTLDSQSKKLMY